MGEAILRKVDTYMRASSSKDLLPAEGLQGVRRPRQPTLPALFRYRGIIVVYVRSPHTQQMASDRGTALYCHMACYIRVVLNDGLVAGVRVIKLRA